MPNLQLQILPMFGDNIYASILNAMYELTEPLQNKGFVNFIYTENILKSFLTKCKEDHDAEHEAIWNDMLRPEFKVRTVKEVVKNRTITPCEEL